MFVFFRCNITIVMMGVHFKQYQSCKMWAEPMHKKQHNCKCVCLLCLLCWETFLRVPKTLFGLSPLTFSGVFSERSVCHTESALLVAKKITFVLFTQRTKHKATVDKVFFRAKTALIQGFHLFVAHHRWLFTTCPVLLNFPSTMWLCLLQ